MQRSNLHPAVAAGASPQGVYMGTSGADPSPIAAKSLFGSFAGPNPLSPTHDAQLTMNEALARTRARELMQSYARDKQRTHELEQQVARMSADNDELALVSSQLQRQVKDLTAFGVQQEDNFAVERREFDAAFSRMKMEMEKVTASSAHQVSDLMAQLRLREEEVAHVQGELNRAVEENIKLRREIARSSVGGEPAEGSDLQKAQARSVELARRLLESERAKRSAEDALIEDRKHHHMALNTIEQLRQQLAASEGRVDNERRKREDEVLQLRRQLDQVREDYDQREDAYKRVLLTGKSASEDDAEGGETKGKNASSSATSNTNLALLCSTLEARTQSQQEHIDFLSEQNEKATTQLQNAIKELQTEKARRVEEVTKAQEVIRGLKDDGTRRELAIARKDKERVVTALADLKSLYEESIDHFANFPTINTGGGRQAADGAIIARTLGDIHSTLRQILSAAQVPLADANNGNDQTQKLLESLMKQIANGGLMGGAVGKTVSSGSMPVGGDEFVSGTNSMNPTDRSTSANARGINSLASFEHQRQMEQLKRALEESERSKELALAERDERDAQREREVRAQIEQLVAHTQRLQRQAQMDEEELANVRFQLQTSEANAAARLARTRKDCARSIDGLHSVLKEIEAEHKAMLHRRYATHDVAVSAEGGGDGSQWQAPQHEYYYGKDATSSPNEPTQAEMHLGSKISDALRQQETLLQEWHADDNSLPPSHAHNVSGGGNSLSGGAYQSTHHPLSGASSSVSGSQRYDPSHMQQQYGLAPSSGGRGSRVHSLPPMSDNGFGDDGRY